MVLDHESHRGALRNNRAAKGAPQRNGRHYKSSSVLNCAANGGQLLASSSSMALNQSAGPALPRLANALKSLISSAGSNGSFKSKCAFVDAGDEVIYYSNAPSAPTKCSSQGVGGATGAQQTALDQQRWDGEERSLATATGDQQPKRSPSLTRLEICREGTAVEEDGFSASSSSHYFSHRQPTTLEQIRQLYKSVPNFSSFDDEDGEHANADQANNSNNNENAGNQQPHMSSRCLEERLGRLCPPAKPSRKCADQQPGHGSHGGAGCCPPPLQQQRKRLPLLLATAHRNGGGADPAVHFSVAGGSPGSSAASSLSSANSTRSGPAEAKWTAVAFGTMEQVGEQSEKMVTAPATTSSNMAMPTTTTTNSPPGSLASCSLGSGGSSASGRSSNPPPETKTENNNGQVTAAAKCSPTDSGYRSRGDTPKGRSRPLSMLCGSRGTLEEDFQQRTQANFALFPPPRASARPTTAAAASAEKSCLLASSRTFIWAEPAPTEVILNACLPFTEADICALLREELALASEEESAQLGILLCQALGNLLDRFWTELRRLSAVLLKCTERDVGTATLLLLPSELAWDCLRYGTVARENLAKCAGFEPTAAKGSSSNQQMSLGSRARLKHLEAGPFLRWMLDSRVAAISDQKSALFLASIFDWLLSQFLQLLKRDPRFGLWIARLESGGLLPLLCQHRPFSKHYRLLLGGPADQTSTAALGNLLRNISLSKLVFPGQFATVEAELFGDSSDQIAIEEEAILALHFWLNCHKSEKKNNKSSEQLEDWLRNAAIFAVHRRAQRVQDIDVMQAARLLLWPNFDCPPPCPSQFCLDPVVGCCPASKALLLGQRHWDQSAKPKNGQHLQKAALAEQQFAEWTPLCWAVALGRLDAVGQMLGAKEWTTANSREEELKVPLQLCALTGTVAIGELLLRHGANPFKSAAGTFSAFALSAARGDATMLGLFLGCCAFIRRNSGQQLLLLANPCSTPPTDSASLQPLLARIKPGLLTEPERRAFGEAMFLAAETGRLDVATQLRAIGIAWPRAEVWLRSLEWLLTTQQQQGEMAAESGSVEEEQRRPVVQLLDDFGPRLGEQLMAAGGAHKRAERLANLLFPLLNPIAAAAPPVSVSAAAASTFEPSSSVQRSAARLLSALFQQMQKSSLSQLEREFSVYFPSHAMQPGGGGGGQQPQIDPKFVDCAELSDIRFRFADGSIVFGHRIVLVNASEQFRQMLRSPCGVVDIAEASADAFRLLLEFAYGNVAKCLTQLGRVSAERQLDLLRLAARFGVQRLVEAGQKTVGAALSADKFARVYAFAHELGLEPLVDDCERFAIAHLPELLDDRQLFHRREESVRLLSRLNTQFQLAARESKI